MMADVALQLHAVVVSASRRFEMDLHPTPDRRKGLGFDEHASFRDVPSHAPHGTQIGLKTNRKRSVQLELDPVPAAPVVIVFVVDGKRNRQALHSRRMCRGTEMWSKN